jgi:hypothetical protein
VEVQEKMRERESANERRRFHQIKRSDTQAEVLHCAVECAVPHARAVRAPSKYAK